VSIVGFKPYDFEAFSVQGFNERMGQIYEHVRPKLVRLGNELAPELGRKLHMEFFPHVAKHARRTVNPPAETWAAFGPSAKGYKRYGYLALCVSGAGLHARAVVKSEADQRCEMAQMIRAKAADLVRAFRGTPIGRYDKWDFKHLPAPAAADEAFFDALASALQKKTGGIDIGFGWNVRESLRLDRAELIEAWRELEPLYRILQAVS
jgi:uncharacterized protein YktB (UPF0637 family)